MIMKNDQPLLVTVNRVTKPVPLKPNDCLTLGLNRDAPRLERSSIELYRSLNGGTLELNIYKYGKTLIYIDKKKDKWVYENGKLYEDIMPNLDKKPLDFVKQGEAIIDQLAGIDKQIAEMQKSESCYINVSVIRKMITDLKTEIDDMIHNPQEVLDDQSKTG